MNYTIRYNATTNHIAGNGIKATLATEFTMNHCGSLTRSRLAEGKSFETAAEAIAYLETNGRKVCKTCMKALVAAAETEAAETETETETETEAAETEAPKMTVTWSTQDGSKTGTVPVTSREEADTRIAVYRRRGLRAVKTFA